VTKYLKDTISKEKDLFGLTVLEVSVHGQLATFLWTCGGAEHHVNKRLCRGSCSPHYIQEIQGEEWKGVRAKISPSKARNGDPLSPTRPQVPQFHHLPIVPKHISFNHT
jgi:hypothetical protein